ncbi:hypothetical protein BJ912DRAFT_900968 [Pholiota molesta]|nr:hypothetical protein BJ912DRAFT_900968 [Pholiota molesta]
MNQEHDDSESLELLGDEEFDDRRERSSSFKRSALFPNPSTVLSMVLVLFFLLDIIAFIFIGKLLLDASQSIEGVENMEFRNPYIGLDELYGSQRINVSRYAALVNEPRLAVQISPAHPDKVFPFDVHRWLSDFGLLSPPDRHLQVSSKSEIHTVVQFSVLDYGMENCALAIRLPLRGDTLPHPFLLPSMLDTVPLQICEVDAKRPLKERLISWSTRPTCLRLLGVVEARIGEETETERFFCKSGSFLGYQISCAENSPQCEIDVWTNQNKTWGIFIKQYQSIL